ncbi:MAG: hypothetical protein R3B60_00580 [Candidatus Paceibacterota bacterium]
MSDIRDQDNIDDLRKRLYDRGQTVSDIKRHSLTDQKIDVARGWGDVAKPVVTTTIKENPDTNSNLDTNTKNNNFQSNFSSIEDREENTTPKNDLVIDSVVRNNKEETKTKKGWSFRSIVLTFSITVFVIAAIVSSAYIYLGANQISGGNINISLDAPFAVAAGDILPLQFSITNQNSVPIESVTLIINYPSGSKAGDESGRDLYEERISLDDIGPSEAINVPVKAILFGEENQDKEIKASVEYRVKNSNGTFFKEIEPILVRINSSPLVLRVDSVNKVSSGQEVDITVDLSSNSQTPLRNVLVTTNYPNTFSFISSEPAPSSGQNGWLLEEVLPEKSYQLKIRGLITGFTNEESEIQFIAGNPRSDNQFIISSILTQTKINYEIEEPFTNVVVSVNGESGNSIILKQGEGTSVSIDVTNTLNETVYDMRVEAAPKGNVIRDNALSVSSGFYDSTYKTINWEIASTPALEEVRPNESRRFSFGVNPDSGQSTASFDVSVKVFARRVNEAGASEELIGTAIAEIKYSSEIETLGQASHGGGIFSDQGPIPPQAGKTTDYTITLSARAGVNDASDAVLTTSLPQYISWNDKYDGPGKVEFNPVSKQLRWEIGDIKAKSDKQLKFQVSLLPSVTHIGRTLTLVERQNLLAKDRFTGTNLQDRNDAISSELSTELGFEKENGKVQE